MFHRSLEGHGCARYLTTEILFCKKKKIKKSCVLENFGWDEVLFKLLSIAVNMLAQPSTKLSRESTSQGKRGWARGEKVRL